MRFAYLKDASGRQHRENTQERETDVSIQTPIFTEEYIVVDANFQEKEDHIRLPEKTCSIFKFNLTYNVGVTQYTV